MSRSDKRQQFDESKAMIQTLAIGVRTLGEEVKKEVATMGEDVEKVAKQVDMIEEEVGKSGKG